MIGKRFLSFTIALVIIFCACIFPRNAQAAVLKTGSRGASVRTLQSKLKRWGYYNGSVDGIFGAQTESSVKSFQRSNGLSADGVVGDATAKALGMDIKSTQTSSSSNSGSNSSNVYLLAKLIYAESRGEPYKGQVAVGSVVLNRVESSSFPNSMAGVIYQSGAFSVVADGQINLSPNETALKAARDALNGWDPTNGCLYYYNPAKTSNKWIRSRPIMLTIGEHVFCK
ncbi:MAG: spore cortex-lytic enzyme [Clostridia bacterium]|nr:spore cortex-lytic enzyme [Clostridia bacterium]